MVEKYKHKIVIGCEILLLCMMIGVLGTSAASSNPPSSGVSYSKNSQTTVEGALNDLYNKANSGNATAAQVLSGKTALVGGKLVTGTMTNRGTVSVEVKQGGTYTIPAGYHSGSGKVVCTGSTTTEPTTPVTPATTLADLKIGDYVNYKPSQTSYSLSSAVTGVSSIQTIKPSELTLWRVIQKNSDGTVDIVSQYVSNQDLKLSHYTRAVYDNYIGTLNSIASAYENAQYTAGSRHMGYTGDIALVRSALGDLKASCVEDASLDSGTYWLAEAKDIISIYVSGYGNYNKISVNPPSTSSRSVRPIVVLKSTLKITGGNGTESSPYTLGV